MHGQEIISKFNSRILIMVNDFFTPGELFSEKEIYKKKILRSVNLRYHPKFWPLKNMLICLQ